MSTSSPSVFSLSERNPNLVPVLRDQCNLTITEFDVLALCVRDDEHMKFALSDFQAKQNEARLEAVHSLEEKGLIYHSPTTGRWEMTIAGVVIWQTIPFLVQGYQPVTKKVPAPVLCIQSGTSA